MDVYYSHQKCELETALKLMILKFFYKIGNGTVPTISNKMIQILDYIIN